MSIYQKIKHELTKERHNEFIDGFLDAPTGIIYSIMDKEDKAELRMKSAIEHEGYPGTAHTEQAISCPCL